MKKYDTESTAEVIDKIIYAAENYLIRDLKQAADKLRKSDNFDYAVDAQQAVLNFLMNSRLDLLITRPIREMSNH